MKKIKLKRTNSSLVPTVANLSSGELAYQESGGLTKLFIGNYAGSSVVQIAGDGYAFNSSPTAPTPTAGDNSSKVATTQYTDTGLVLKTNIIPLTLAVSNLGAGGNIGTADTTVDIYEKFDINQKTAGQTITLPNPTNLANKRIVYVENKGTASILIHGIRLNPGYQANFIFNGTSWVALQIPDVFTGSTISSDGTSGLVPRPLVTQNSYFLRGDGIWAKSDPHLLLSRKVLSLAEGTYRCACRHRTYLMANNTIKCTGSSDGNQNGDNVTRLFPNSVASTDNTAKFVKIFEGSQECFALDSNGNAWAWGNNGNGQLGLGDTINRMVITKIQYFVTNAITITNIVPSTGNSYLGSYRSTYFITSTGMIYACGYNAYGQLGNGNTTQQTIPVRCGTITDIVNISASGTYGSVLAVTSTGSLYVWGKNSNGQLGTGDAIDLNTPTLSTVTNVAKVVTCSDDANKNYSIILKTDGTIWSSGINSNGQLGLGDTKPRNTFTQVTINVLGSVFTDIQAVGGLYGLVSAITNAKELYVWGYGNVGALGSGETENITSPSKPSLGSASIFQGTVDSVRLTGSESYQTLYVKSGDMIYATGYNGNGQLSDGTTTNRTTFQSMIGINGIISNYRPYGVKNTLYGLSILYSDGRVAACGSNAYGECGTRASDANQLLLADVLF